MRLAVNHNLNVETAYQWKQGSIWWGEALPQRVLLRDQSNGKEVVAIGEGDWWTQDRARRLMLWLDDVRRLVQSKYLGLDFQIRERVARVLLNRPDGAALIEGEVANRIEVRELILDALEARRDAKPDGTVSRHLRGARAVWSASAVAHVVGLCADLCWELVTIGAVPYPPGDIVPAALHHAHPGVGPAPAVRE